MIFKVIIGKKALKQISHLPPYIIEKLQSWIEAVGREGLEKVRRIPGYHDEPLKGLRHGQRSIRLSTKLSCNLCCTR